MAITRRTKSASQLPRPDPLTQAFRAARDAGWLPCFRAAADAHGFSASLLLAIAYRESSLKAKYLQSAGDGGNGYGLMQIDKRAFPQWVESGAWKQAESAIAKGAEVLAAWQDRISQSAGKQMRLKSSAGETVSFVGKPLAGDDLLRVAVAAYNCGLWAYYHYSKGHDIDRGTTGANYSADVLKNEKRFAALLAEQDTAAGSARTNIAATTRSTDKASS